MLFSSLIMMTNSTDRYTYRYTGTQDGDPSSILHTAYETTVNEAPVAGDHTEITIQQEHKN